MVMTRVGIVNSSADATEMLDLCLTRAGFAVIPMRGQEHGHRVSALSAFARHERLELIVFDLATPVTANLRWLLTAQASTPELPPVVITTSTRQPIDPHSAADVVFIGAPYRLEVLVRRVRRAVAMRRQCSVPDTDPAEMLCDASPGVR